MSPEWRLEQDTLTPGWAVLRRDKEPFTPRWWWKRWRGGEWSFRGNGYVWRCSVFPLWTPVGWCCRVCHGLIVLRPTSLFTRVHVVMQAGGDAYNDTHTFWRSRTSFWSSSILSLWKELKVWRGILYLQPAGGLWYCRSGQNFRVRFELVEANPSSVVDGSLEWMDGWIKMAVKEVAQLAPLETLLYRKKGGFSGMCVCIYIYTPQCWNEKERGQESQTLTGTKKRVCVCVCMSVCVRVCVRVNWWYGCSSAAVSWN